eukprot:TRINITY_DN2121_c0_g1_i1.p1 TRINITY_DN2121_c0_g1~~TRINITY_DN2121_c0_g1_i1.p1  ORF type:complete len:451 (+),score=69.58 TRINITY_DN2121_c0_g1_i1:105-1457(+)
MDDVEEQSAVPALLQLCAYRISSEIGAFPDIGILPTDLKEVLFCYVLSNTDSITEQHLAPFLDADLRVVNLANRSVQFTSSFIGTLTKFCPHLEELTVTGVYSITDQLIEQLLKQCNTIQRLNLAYCSKIRGKFFSSLRLAPSLRALDLSGLGSLDDQDISVLTANAPNLHSLKLRIVSKITDNSLTDIVTRCKQLRVLDLTECFRIHRLEQLVSALPDLEDLSIGGLRIEGATLLQICRNHKLTHLDISRCPSVLTIQEVVAMLNVCTKLSHLNCTGNNLLTSPGHVAQICAARPAFVSLGLHGAVMNDDDYAALEKHAPSLRSLDISLNPIMLYMYNPATSRSEVGFVMRLFRKCVGCKVFKVSGRVASGFTMDRHEMIRTDRSLANWAAIEASLEPVRGGANDTPAHNERQSYVSQLIVCLMVVTCLCCCCVVQVQPDSGFWFCVML